MNNRYYFEQNNNYNKNIYNKNNNILENSGKNCLSYNNYNKYKNYNNFNNSLILNKNQQNFNKYFNNINYNYNEIINDNFPYKIEQKIQYQYLPKKLNFIEIYKNDDLQEKNIETFSISKTPKKLWFSSEYSSQYKNYFNNYFFDNNSIIAKPSNLVLYTNDMFRKRDITKDYKKPVYKFEDLNIPKDFNFMNNSNFINDSLLNHSSLNKSLSNKNNSVLNGNENLNNILNISNKNINDNNNNNILLNQSANKSISSNKSLQNKNNVGEEIICGIIEGTGNNAKRPSEIEDFYVDGGNNEINIFKKLSK